MKRALRGAGCPSGLTSLWRLNPAERVEAMAFIQRFSTGPQWLPIQSLAIE
jgi:hypothetical protein